MWARVDLRAGVGSCVEKLVGLLKVAGDARNGELERTGRVGFVVSVGGKYINAFYV